MEQVTLTVYHPQFIMDGNQKFHQVALTETYLQHPETKKWHPFFTEATAPIKQDSIYLTEVGALNHSIWMYAYNESGYCMYPTCDVQVVPPQIDPHEYKVIPVTIIDGRLVELSYDTPPIYTAFSNYPQDWEENTTLALEALKSPNPDAAIQLLGLMEAISEEHHCAGWLTGNEYALLEIMQQALNEKVIRSSGYGMGYIPASQINLMINLHQKCKGWWYWNEDKGHCCFNLD